MKIVVTGSLGHISKPFATELVQKGHSVTIISSKAERQKDIEALGANAAIGTVQDVAFLTKTFTGADIVYLMEPGDPSVFFDPNFDPEADIRQTVNNFKHAVQQSGVKKLVHLSSIGAHTNKGNGMLALHHLAESILKQLPNDVSIKFIRPVGFYNNLLANVQMINQTSQGFMGSLLALRFYGLGGLFGGKRGVIVSNYGDKDVIPWASPLDIASAIAEEIGKPFNGRTIRYVASEELTCNEVAKTLGKAIDKPYLKWGVLSDKQILNAMLKMKMNETVAKGLVEMNAAQHSGRLFEDYYQNRPTLGKIKITDFAKEFAEAYKQK